MAMASKARTRITTMTSMASTMISPLLLTVIPTSSTAMLTTMNRASALQHHHYTSLLTDIPLALIMTIISSSREAIISKTAIMMTAANRVIRMNITTTSITTREVPKPAMGEFHQSGSATIH